MYAIKIIETAHRTDKIGCDVNLPDGYRTKPLEKIFVIKRDYPESDILFNIELVQSLVFAGARLNTFGDSKTALDLIMESDYDKDGHAFHFDINGSIVSNYYGNILSTSWDPSIPIPEHFNKPVVRFLIKMMFELSEFVSDHIYMSSEELQKFIESLPEKQYPSGINRLIIAYASPYIQDIRSLSCYNRSTQFYNNLLYLGKAFSKIKEEQRSNISDGQSNNIKVSNNLETKIQKDKLNTMYSAYLKYNSALNTSKEDLIDKDNAKAVQEQPNTSVTSGGISKKCVIQ